MERIQDCRILIVDDNRNLQQMVKDILSKEGFAKIDAVSCCRECREYLETTEPELILLDVGLPDGDGFSLMQQIRQKSQVPVLFLSARDEDADRLLGLGLGADDYITKPFLPRELVLRVTAVLKRAWFPIAKQRKEEMLFLGETAVDLQSGTVEGKDGSAQLTAKELTILRKLAENRGRIVTFDAITQGVWNDYYYGYENTLMVHIRRLREKVEKNPSSPEWILTVRGLGYKLK